MTKIKDVLKNVVMRKLEAAAKEQAEAEKTQAIVEEIMNKANDLAGGVNALKDLLAVAERPLFKLKKLLDEDTDISLSDAIRLDAEFAATISFVQEALEEGDDEDEDGYEGDGYDYGDSDQSDYGYEDEDEDEGDCDCCLCQQDQPEEADVSIMQQPISGEEFVDMMMKAAVANSVNSASKTIGFTR